MGFTPIIRTRVADPPSARAQDLGRRLKAEVEKFETQYPGTSRKDLRAAAALAIGEESVGATPRRRVAGLVGGIVALGVIFLGLGIRSIPDGPSPPWLKVLPSVALSLAVVAGIVFRRSRR